MKSSTIKLSALGLALLIGAAPIAQAGNFPVTEFDPFYLNVRDLFGGDGKTDNLEALTSLVSATSTYTDDDGTPGLSTGDTVEDVGFGGVTAAKTDPFKLPPLDLEGLNATTGAGWTFDISYDAKGTTIVAPPLIVGDYTEGTVTLNYREYGVADPLDIQVLSLNITGSLLTVGNFLLFGDVEYASWFDVDTDPNAALIANMFQFVDATDGYTSFYDIAVTSGLSLAIDWRFDTNVDVFNVVPIDNGDGTYTRTSDLDGSNRFRVRSIPEPATLALMGIGMLGMGFVRRMTGKS